MTSAAHPASGRIGFYGDDFTGATDALATATQAGLRTVLFLALPCPATLAAAGRLDCIGIAGAARAMGRDELRAELAPVADFFAARGVQVLHYKTCSTFDSSPELGNLAQALATLRRRFANPFAPIVGGQPNLGRYCVFGNLFASLTTGGPVYRLDRHATMRNHPVTPMLEADLRRHLACQGLAPITHIDYTRYALPASQLARLLDEMLAQQPGAVLFDVAETAHLKLIGTLIWQHAARAALVALGPSSVLQALADAAGYGGAPAMPETPSAPAEPAVLKPRAASGPVFVLAGSLSPITAAQVAAAHAFVRVPLDAARLLAGDSAYGEAARREVAGQLRAGRHVLAHTDAPRESQPGALPSAAGEPPGRRLARAHGAFLRGVLESVPLQRVGVAGGDTSSFALQALDVWGLSYLGQLAPGVALCRAHAHGARLDGVELMLKGGQMGPPDMFARLIEP